MSSLNGNPPLLLRAARGEAVERSPVWLMRQAGRYMAQFREYSTKYPFRQRSETPEIAIELSLQPWKAFGTDAVIMFSDILTPLPAIGKEFDMVPGVGPKIDDPIRSQGQVKNLRPLEDPSIGLGFVGQILQSLREEVGQQATVIGFIGTPWTLAAYLVEGQSSRYCLHTKQMMLHNPEILHDLLQQLTDALTNYVCYQIDNGAQIVQLFDSWAHHLTPEYFKEFSLDYAEQIIQNVRKVHPNVPLIYHANGGTGKLQLIKQHCSPDVVGLDQWTTMKDCRQIFGNDQVLQGNVDPTLLFGTSNQIENAVKKCQQQAGFQKHILNVGHGVIQGFNQDAVSWWHAS
eukprot:TRINITY_DN2425_c1_g1_i7.p1 TRINITY_DN2425_c1_g1~~TRINITY_DN2425_c1_g1_i7.p1  ORF type:complete len:381 (+),score=32.05 TRINITY_DN2425_c1_g1_i7:110-1144(+)